MKIAEKREEELRQQIAALKAASERDKTTHEEISTQPFWGQPFCKEIDETDIPPNFREVIVESFDGSQDPYAHLQAFHTQMYISGGNDRLSCKLFLGTLRGVAMQWMATLPPRFIQTFKDLANSFVSQFVANKVKKLEKGLRAGPFSDTLALKKPISMEEIRARVKKHVEMEEDQFEQRKSEQGSNRKDTRHLAKAKEDKHPMLARTNEHTLHFTPLTEKRTQILREIYHTTLLEFPQGTKGKVMGRTKMAGATSTKPLVTLLKIVGR
ncbi:hypothetical protein CR513_15107, partial [Mucuna pruriens]